MFQRKSNRKRTNARKQANRNQVTRSIGVERLQDRELMAADFDLLPMMQGPQLPSAEPVAAMVATTATSTESNATTTDGFYHVDVTLNSNGLVVLEGTVFDDTVAVSQSGNFVTITTTTTYNGDYLGSSEATFARSSLTGIQFFGSYGIDNFVNATNLTTYAFGGPGNDTLQSGTAPINYLYGDDGDDVLIGNFNVDHMAGGNGDDVIRGNGGNDFLYGDAGEDRLYGGSGHDELFGGNDADSLYGSTGNDLLRGGNGNDRIFGQGGDDTMFGDAGHDFLSGSSGDDVMLGGSGSDTLDGGFGDDRMDGGSSNDVLYGGAGRDELFGRGGLDWLFGGSDRDLLDGGDDGIADQLFGGTGSDIFIRHKHVFTADDPDQFRDFSDLEADEKFNDWGWSNYGNDFPS